ncbi:MAG: hypothetical protein SXV54_26155 [Chloroflexota bacterium]|nr:hypothetical protein [Chloroflexota bacterium]
MEWNADNSGEVENGWPLDGSGHCYLGWADELVQRVHDGWRRQVLWPAVYGSTGETSLRDPSLAHQVNTQRAPKRNYDAQDAQRRWIPHPRPYSAGECGSVYA